MIVLACSPTNFRSKLAGSHLEPGQMMGLLLSTRRGAQLLISTPV